MPVVLRTFRLPGWLVPVLLLLALVLLPFALMLALGVGVLALAGGLAAALLPGRREESPSRTPGRTLPGSKDPQVIDAEFEVRNEL